MAVRTEGSPEAQHVERRQRERAANVSALASSAIPDKISVGLLGDFLPAKLQKDDGIFDKDIISIDLRMADRVSVQTSETAAEKRRNLKKNKEES